MLHQLACSVRTTAFVVALGAHVASAAVLTDDFNGDAGSPPNPALWSSAGTTGTARLNGASQVVLDVNFAGSSNRRMIVTQENGFNPFTAPVTIQLSDIAVAGSPDNLAGHFATGFVALGLSNEDVLSRYHFGGGSTGMDTGVIVVVNLSPSGNYTLDVRQFVNTASGGMSTYALSGAPTGLTITVNGAGQTISVAVQGTVFTATGLAVQNQALHADFIAANMSIDNAVISRVTVGAMNRGAVQGPGSKFLVGSINVVPEPASIALLGAGLLLVVRRCH